MDTDIHMHSPEICTYERYTKMWFTEFVCIHAIKYIYTYIYINMYILNMIKYVYIDICTYTNKHGNRSGKMTSTSAQHVSNQLYNSKVRSLAVT